MIDEADVNEAIAGPQQKKVRPMSPRDIGRIRRKRPGQSYPGETFAWDSG